MDSVTVCTEYHTFLDLFLNFPDASCSLKHSELKALFPSIAVMKIQYPNISHPAELTRLLLLIRIDPLPIPLDECFLRLPVAILAFMSSIHLVRIGCRNTKISFGTQPITVPTEFFHELTIHGFGIQFNIPNLARYAPNHG